MEITLEKLIDDSVDAATYQYFKGLSERRIVFNDEVSEDIVE